MRVVLPALTEGHPLCRHDGVGNGNDGKLNSDRKVQLRQLPLWTALYSMKEHSFHSGDQVISVHPCLHRRATDNRAMARRPVWRLSFSGAFSLGVLRSHRALCAVSQPQRRGNCSNVHYFAPWSALHCTALQRLLHHPCLCSSSQNCSWFLVARAPLPPVGLVPLGTHVSLLYIYYYLHTDISPCNDQTLRRRRWGGSETSHGHQPTRGAPALAAELYSVYVHWQLENVK